VLKTRNDVMVPLSPTYKPTDRGDTSSDFCRTRLQRLRNIKQAYNKHQCDTDKIAETGV